MVTLITFIGWKVQAIVKVYVVTSFREHVSKYGVRIILLSFYNLVIANVLLLRVIR
jgi:hypothetical protein